MGHDASPQQVPHHLWPVGHSLGKGNATTMCCSIGSNHRCMTYYKLLTPEDRVPQGGRAAWRHRCRCWHPLSTRPYPLNECSDIWHVQKCAGPQGHFFPGLQAVFYVNMEFHVVSLTLAVRVQRLLVLVCSTFFPRHHPPLLQLGSLLSE